MNTRTLRLGATRPLDGAGFSTPLELPADDLVTHTVVTGMTGSGKTGLLTVMVEEALGANVPVLMIDVKGDLPDLLLAFPSSDPAHFAAWDTDGAPAAQVASARHAALARWGIDDAQLAAFRARTALRVITPGSTAGEPLHVLSSLETRSPRWDTDLDAARASLAAAVSLVLRIVGRDPDPARSREHVLLSVLAERRLRAGAPAELPALLGDLVSPPIETVGALALDAFMPADERRALAAALDALLASPSFATWRTGVALDPGAWLAPRADGRTPGVIVSVAHLDDEARALVLGVLFEEVLAWTRSLPGARGLRALVVFDEVYGFMPPHPRNPPTKRPLVAMMKQARAFGVGVVVATQDPMDLDYRALGNAGVWCIGRLQTDADRARVVEGLGEATGKGTKVRELGATIKRLGPRWFVLRDVHAGEGSVLLQPREAMSWLRGPLTRSEISAALASEARGAAGP